MVKKKSSGAKKGSDSKSEKVEQSSKSSKNNINYWMIATVVLSLVLVIGIIYTSTSGVSKKKAEKEFLEFAKLQGVEDMKVLNVKSVSNMYQIEFSLSGQAGYFYISKDGKYIGQMDELEEIKTYLSSTTGNVVQDVPDWSINECALDKGISENAVVFYYSDSCGWCARMKPGVASLVERGYNIISANAAEKNPLMDECIIPHMTSGGVPQFICIKTGEIKVGAFTDANSNLNQEAMDAWVMGCLNS